MRNTAKLLLKSANGTRKIEREKTNILKLIVMVLMDGFR
jgi:hypothetical protein